ncbi:MAG: sensor histidine kinase [Bacteroidota bacterium]
MYKTFVLFFLVLACYSSQGQKLRSFEPLLRSNADSALIIFSLILDTAKTLEVRQEAAAQRLKAQSYSGKVSHQTIKEDIDSLLITDIPCFLRIDLLNLRSVCFFYTGKVDSALLMLKKVTNYRPVCDSSNYAKAVSNLAAVYTQLRQIDSAIKFYNYAIRYDFAVKDTFKLASDLNNLGSAYYFIGSYNEALALLDSSLQYATNDALKGRNYLTRSLVQLERYKLDESEQDALEAERLLRLANSPTDLAQVIIIRSRLALYANDIQGSNKFLKEARKIAERNNDRKAIQQIEHNEAEIMLLQGNPSQALSKLKEAYQYNLSIDRNDFAANTARLLSLTFSALRNYDSANYYSQKSEELSYLTVQESYLSSLADLKTKYQTAEKERQLAESELEVKTKEATISSQQNTLIMVVAGAGFVLLLGLLIYNRKQVEQKQKLQEERESGYQNVINATEEERKRISKDLHDGIGQQLSAIKLALGNFSKKVSGDSKAEIEKMTESFSKSADEVRSISHQMMPLALMENGLVHAIEDLLQSSFQFSEIKHQFEHRLKNERFDEKIEISLYRITQELINNIIKHAGATEVSVQLIEVKNKLTLFVEDNGVGLGQNVKRSGMGLLNIQSRLEIVQGKVNYEQAAGSGTSAVVSIPLV